MVTEPGSQEIPISQGGMDVGDIPEVSVIVNCFNEARFLPETLDSVFAQTFHDWEIVFWDNASTDSSSEIAASYGEKVRCFRSDTLVPLGQARQLAYEQTRGRYIAILDADDIWLPQKLERQLALFRSEPHLGMVYCDATFFDDKGDRHRLFQLNKPHRGAAFGHLLARVAITPSSMFLRREAVEQLDSVFDARYGRAQDVDLCLRVAYHHAIDYVDEPLCKWRMVSPAEKPWKTALAPRTVEIRSMMENLLERYPEIKTKYQTELQSFYGGLDYFFAVTAWENGNPGEARSYLSPHLISKKVALVYLSTFFLSFKLFAKLTGAYRAWLASRS